jgi:hypothetical protein
MFSKILLVAATLTASETANPGPTVAKAERVAQVQPDVGDLSGYYTCKGQETGGKAYSGICQVTKKNDVYIVQWMVGGGAAFSGIGIRQGNNLAVSWTMPGEKGTVRGVNLYRVETGPRLVGRWASVPGPGLMQSETLTFLKQAEEED